MNKETKIKETLRILEELSHVLDDIISDLHNVKGGMQARHAYCYYRKYVWEAIAKLKQETT